MALAAANSRTDDRHRELVEHGSARFPVACYELLSARDFIPLHWHEPMEIIVVSQGSVLIHGEEGPQEIHCGEGFFWNANVLHGAWEQTSSPYCIHSAVFWPQLVGGTADSVFWQRYVRPVLENSALKALHLKPSVDWQCDILSAFNSAWESCRDEEYAYELHMRSEFSRIMALLCRHCPPCEHEPTQRELRRAERVRRMIAFIHARFADDITAADIAAAAAVSESESVRCFRSMLGMPPTQYLKQYRIMRAAQLLQSTNKTAAEISGLCGFRDQSYFTRSFRERMGQTPAQYRVGKTNP